MPQGVPQHIPFPSRISRDVERARCCHLAWPRSLGLLPTEESEVRHLQGDYAGLAARFHPSATGADLDLGVDQQSWYFIFDDQFDGPIGQDPALAEQLTDSVAAVLDSPQCIPPRNAAPVVAAFADLWARCCEGMSESWRDRAARHWRDYLVGNVAEATHRMEGGTLRLNDQLALRNHTIGARGVLDIAERLGHFEVPESAYRTPLMAEMRRIVAEVVIFENDIVSVEKEEACGDHNLVHLVERENRCSRTRSIEIICELLSRRTERFLALESELPQLYDSLRLDDNQRSAIERYRTDALRSVMRGVYDWDQVSGRYAETVDNIFARA